MTTPLADASSHETGRGFGSTAGWLTRNQLRRVRRRMVVAGVLALVLGFVSIAVPAVTSVAISVLVGWILVAAGVALGIRAISARAPWRAVESLLAVIAGLYILILPLSGTVTLTFVLAVWFIASGIITLIDARGAPTWSWPPALGGLLSVILGILIAVKLPSSAAWAIGLLVGINLIIWGVEVLAASRLLRDFGQT